MLFYLFSFIIFLNKFSLVSQPIPEPVIISETRTVEEYPISIGPILESKSAIVVDNQTGKILFEKNKNEVSPVASLTKLMTAIVFLENRNKDWGEWVTYKKEDKLEPAWINIAPGDQIKIKDVFNTALVGSANDATLILARLVKNPENFVEEMNKKARSFGMKKTKFLEPTGLDPKNVSTASDLSILIKKALEIEKIKETLQKKEIDFQIKKADGSFYWRRIKNTDKLLDSFINISGAKTGYLEESDYCFAGIGGSSPRRSGFGHAGGSSDGQSIVVVLGAPTSETRFKEAKILFWWGGK